MPKIVKLVANDASGASAGVRNFAALESIPLAPEPASAHALLVIAPKGTRGWSLAAELSAYKKAGKPYCVTDGVRFSRVEAWLDSLACEFDELVLHVTGPPSLCSSKAEYLTELTLQRIFESAPPLRSAFAHSPS